jgi:hypothetical protein
MRKVKLAAALLTSPARGSVSLAQHAIPNVADASTQGSALVRLFTAAEISKRQSRR